MDKAYDSEVIHSLAREELKTMTMISLRHRKRKRTKENSAGKWYGSLTRHYIIIEISWKKCSLF
jgi:hypothetical protein